MKKFLFLFIFILLYSLAPFSSNAALMKTSYGESGEHVRTLQQTLQSLGFFSGPSTGYFGPVTQKAVIAYQKANGIPSIGTVGPQTLTSLVSKEAAPTQTTSVRSLSLGVKGNDVKELQLFLKEKGFFTNPFVTDYFGPATQKAVIAYQKANGIPAIGIVGPQTRIKMGVTTTTPAPVITSALKSPEVVVDSKRNDKITISWKSVIGAESYTIRRAEQGSSTYTVVATGVTGTIYTDTTVVKEKTYTYSVSSVSKEKESIPSPTVNAKASTSGGGGGSSAVVADTTAPTVSITAPTASEVVSGSVTLTATGADNVGVAGVTFYIDSVVTGVEDTTAPYSISWDSTGSSDGSVSIVARARDAANNTTNSTAVDVTVDNTGPVISSISSGTPGVTSGTITWTTNENADSKVEYGTTTGYGSEVTSATLETSHSIGVSGLAASTLYHYRVVSVDGEGNTTTSADQTFTTTAVPFPSGAIGTWYIDEYDASTRPVIANASNVAEVSPNLFTGSRNIFGNEGFWTATSIVATNHAGTAPNGTQSATTLVGTGNWVLHPTQSDTLPAGTYTMAVNAKRNTGTDQQFAFYIANTAIRSTTQTTTSVWQRFTYTFTLGSPSTINLIGIGSIDGSTDGNIQITDFELYSGSTDLGPQEYGGHLYLGSSAFDTRASYSSGTLDVSTGGLGIMQFPDTQTFTTMTMQALVSKVATPTAFHSIVSDPDNYSNFSMMTEQSGSPYAYFDGSGAVGPAQQTGLWTATGKGYHVITLRYNGTTFEYWVDDVLMLTQTVSRGPVTVEDMYFNITNVPALYGGNRYAGALVLWDRALSNTEIRTAVEVQQARAALSSVTATDASRVLVAEGDSITGGFSYSYPYKLGTNASPALYGVNYATSGAAITTLNSRASAIDAILPPDTTGRKFILSVLIGANDLNSGYSGPGGTGVDGWLVDLATYLDGRRSAGWDVLMCTVLPNTNSGFNAARNTANTEIRTWVGVHADGICDFAADATMGPDAAASNATYYADGLHPTDAGQTILETIYRAAVNAM